VCSSDLAPVYEAGEKPIEGFDSASLVAGLRAGGHRDARLISGPEVISDIVADIAEPGDIVIFLGAGDITKWAYALPDELAK